MARDIQRFSVTVATGSTKTAPQITNLTMPPREVVGVEIVVPPGPRGEVGFALGSAGTPVIPSTAGAFVVTDNEIIHWPLEGYWDSGAWQLIAYNTGNFAHNIEVRFLCELPGAAAGGVTPIIPASQLVPVMAVTPTGPPPGPAPPSLGLGPFPGPVVPPGPSPGPGVPSPPAPPAPPLPAPPGLPGLSRPPAPPTLARPPGIVLPGPPSAPSPAAGGPSRGATVTHALPDRMYDSTSAADIPAEAVMVAYYDYWPSSTPSPRLASRFYVVLTKDPTHLDADAIDIESGAATIQDGIAWIRAKRARGDTPVAYGTGSTHDALTQAASFYGFAPAARWLAEYDNDPTIPPGFVAKQFANAALTGHHYDLSSVSPDWPGLRAWAGTIGPPATGGGGVLRRYTMRVVTGTGPDPIGPGAIYITDGVVKRFVHAVAEESALLALCGQTTPDLVDQYALDRMPNVASVYQPGTVHVDTSLLPQTPQRDDWSSGHP